MAENSGIEWTHHTFNPWVGCTKISPACDFCYAESWSKRAGRDVWGPRAERQRTKTWGNPVKWNKALEGTGRRERVFCASLADVFDNHNSIQPEWRQDLWKLIADTPNLDWLLLTKRPQNIKKFRPTRWHNKLPDNVWIGTTVENQEEANKRIPYLLNIPAKVRFLSCEPLLGDIDLTEIQFRNETWNALEGAGIEMNGGQPYQLNGNPINWVITGGESGPKFRPANPDWFRSLRNQCEETNTPFLFKQWEGKNQKIIKAKGRELDGIIHDGYPVASYSQERPGR